MNDTYWDGENVLSVIKTTKKVKYYLDGYLHRKDGPAEIRFYDNGSIFIEYYYVNGLQHRDDGPAEIWYSKDKTVYLEAYKLYDKLHRKDGCAVIFHFLNKIEYWYNGKSIILENLPFELPINSEGKEFYMKLKYGDINE